MLTRLTPVDNFAPTLALLHRAFAVMNGRIKPPSSLHLLTTDTLRTEAETKEIWTLQDAGIPKACMILTVKPDTLYLGKLAVDPAHQGRGLARQMLAHAITRAQALGLPSLTLQTRIELVENHALLAHMGFVETARTAHAGYSHPTSLTMVCQVPPDHTG